MDATTVNSEGIKADRQGNRCPRCQEWEAPSWKDGVQYRLECCGVLICRECFDDWKGVRIKVIDEFEEKCGRKAYIRFKKRWSKKLRARVQGEKDKEEAKNKKKQKGGEEDEKKKRALEKLLERHWTCPSCRAPLAITDEDAVIQLRRKAEQGQSWAQCLMGDRYRTGKGVRKDMRQAERWYRAAMTDMSVMDGGPLAAFKLGFMYAYGLTGVRKDVEEAKKLWTMGHEAGHVHATNNLANLFRGAHGLAAGVPDHEKAFTLYRQATETGNVYAQCGLGQCYDNGEGVEQDKEKAKAWYAKAVKQGQAPAMINLALLLNKTEGAASFPTQVALLRAAAETGNPNAQKMLPQCEKHILSSCASCGKPAADMAGAPLKCARCKAAAYCSAECQKQHWKRGGHKRECNGRERYLPRKEERAHSQTKKREENAEPAEENATATTSSAILDTAASAGVGPTVGAVGASDEDATHVRRNKEEKLRKIDEVEAAACARKQSATVAPGTVAAAPAVVADAASTSVDAAPAGHGKQTKGKGSDRWNEEEEEEYRGVKCPECRAELGLVPTVTKIYYPAKCPCCLEQVKPFMIFPGCGHGVCGTCLERLKRESNGRELVHQERLRRREEA